MGKLGAFLLGCLVTALVLEAHAIDLGGISKVGGAVKRLAAIKGNLDKDVKNLKENAVTLLGDKNDLVAIKNQLQQLAAQTKSQIDSIGALVAEVEGHLNKTQANIQSTAKNVGEIDEVRKTFN